MRDNNAPPRLFCHSKCLPLFTFAREFFLSPARLVVSFVSHSFGLSRPETRRPDAAALLFEFNDQKNEWEQNE